MNEISILQKVCFHCKQDKPLKEFYKHPKMPDGHVNKCKVCSKEYAKGNYKSNTLKSGFYDKERSRWKRRYRKKNESRGKPVQDQLPKIYSETWRNFFEKYPEKYKAYNAAQNIKVKVKGNHKHHWSYSNNNLKDIIELSQKDHVFAHTKIYYDQNLLCFRGLDGTILDTRESHIAYLSLFGIKIF